MAIVIINEDHSLFPQQESLLVQKFGDLDLLKILKIPGGGLKLKELEQLAKDLADKEEEIIIASPIPALFKFLSLLGKEFNILHNDSRDKKQLPNGKIIMVVSQEGWVIV